MYEYIQCMPMRLYIDAARHRHGVRREGRRARKGARCLLRHIDQDGSRYPDTRGTGQSVHDTLLKCECRRRPRAQAHRAACTNAALQQHSSAAGTFAVALENTAVMHVETSFIVCGE